jgi:hypothetical protein
MPPIPVTRARSGTGGLSVFAWSAMPAQKLNEITHRRKAIFIGASLLLPFGYQLSFRGKQRIS